MKDVKIYHCSVQFSAQLSKNKKPFLLPPEFLIASFIQDEILFKDSIFQAKHNQYFTPAQTGRITGINVLKKISDLGTTLYNYEHDKRYNKKYNGSYGQ